MAAISQVYLQKVAPGSKCPPSGPRCGYYTLSAHGDVPKVGRWDRQGRGPLPVGEQRSEQAQRPSRIPALTSAVRDGAAAAP